MVTTFEWINLVIEAIYSLAFIILSVMMYRLSKQQSMENKQSQRDAFKLHLFDKRYSVFEAIEGAIALLERKDYSFIFFCEDANPYEINKRVIDAQEELHKASRLSQALFEKEVSLKVVQIEAKFKEVVDEHFKMLKQNITRFGESEIEREKYALIFANQVLETKPEEMEKLNQRLKEECPYIYQSLYEYNQKTADFIQYVNDSGVLTDFDEYMIIDDIDRK